MSQGVPEIYAFSGFRLDAGKRLLLAAGGETVAVMPKAFDTLLLLVRNAGRPVSKDEIFAEVWRGLVVEENNLAQNVSALRKLLGERPGEHRFIATVPGRGYVFVADVQLEHAPSPHVPAAPDAEVGPKPAQAAPWRNWAFAGSLAIVVATLLLYMVTQREGMNGTAISESALTSRDLPDKSVAVLPFENLSADADMEYLALGLSEAVLHQLANLPDLLVIARTSSFAARENSRDVRTIGQILNARYLLEGSVQQDGGQLRVTAQLLDTVTGGHLWSRRFDRNLEDIFAIQDEIAATVAGSLQLSLGEGAGEPSRNRATVDLQAYLEYLRGRRLLMRWQAAETESAAAHFERAIALDPDFAAAYAGLAETRLMSANLEGEANEAIYDAVMPLFDKALALDPTLGEAYALRGRAGLDPTAMEADFRRGLELSPNNARVYELFASFLLNLSRDDEALAMIDQARVLDPLVPRYHQLKALILWWKFDRIEAAEASFLHALEIDPGFTPALMRLGQMRHRSAGEFAEAVRFGEQALAIDPQALWVRYGLAHIYLDLEEVEAVRQIVSATPDRIGDVLISLYAGDRRRAAEVAWAIPGPFEHAPKKSTLAVAVRDDALVTGETTQALEYFAEVLGIDAAPQPASLDWNYLQAYLAYAQLLDTAGEGRRAEQVIAAINQVLTALEDRYGKLAASNERFRAQALALSGDGEGALAALERALAGRAYAWWWYDLRLNPAFAGMRGEPRFQALLADAAAHAAEQRALLNELRAAGRVPDRR